MAINSLTRRLIKRALYPLLNESGYRWVQSMVKARDIKTGTYHEEELDLLPRVLKPGEDAFDIGANFGLYTYHLSRAVGKTGRVFAFEPVTYTFSCLQTVLRRLGVKNVVLIKKGCGNRNQTVTFTLPVQESGAIVAGLSHMPRSAANGVQEEVPETNSRTEVCEIIRIDDLFPDAAPSFLKIDIEGAELHALEGAVELIERSWPTVVCEINPGFLEGYAIELGRLAGFFLDRDYALFRYQSNRLWPLNPGQITGGNYIFVHPHRGSRLTDLIEN